MEVPLYTITPSRTVETTFSSTILKFVQFLVVNNNNNNYLPHVVDDIMFRISVSDYPSRTVESNSLRLFGNFSIFCLLYVHIVNSTKFTYDKSKNCKIRIQHIFTYIQQNTNGRENLFALSGVRIKRSKINQKPLQGPEFLLIFVRIIRKFVLTVFVVRIRSKLSRELLSSARDEFRNHRQLGVSSGIPLVDAKFE